MHYRRAKSLLRRKNKYIASSSVDAASTFTHNGNNNGRRASHSSIKSEKSVTVSFNVFYAREHTLLSLQSPSENQPVVSFSVEVNGKRIQLTHTLTLRCRHDFGFADCEEISGNIINERIDKLWRRAVAR